MDAPKCRLCQKRHYGACNPRDIESGAVAEASGLPVAEVVEKLVSPPEKKSNSDKVSGKDGAVPLEEFFARDFCPECGTNLAARDKARERRRDWMRRKRAAEKK